MNLNKLFFFTIIFSTFISVNAQDKISLGINGGLNYSSLRFENDNISRHDSELGYLIGISSSFYLKERLYLDVELNYERKKVSVYLEEIIINSISFGGGFRIFDVYEFLTLPIFLKYEVAKTNALYIKGGPFFGYFLTAKERVNKGNLSQNLSEYFTNFDFGIALGIGKEIHLNNSNKLILELRNYLGLSNINSDSKSKFTKTNSINLIVGWKFVL